MNVEEIKQITDQQLLDEYNKLNYKEELEMLYLETYLKELIKKRKKDNIYDQLVFRVNSLSYLLNNFFSSNRITLEDAINFRKILKKESRCLKILSSILYKNENVHMYKYIYLYLSALETVISKSTKNYNILLKQNEYELKNINYYHPQDSNLTDNINDMELVETYIKKLELKY